MRSYMPNAKRKAVAYRNMAADVPEGKILNHTDAIFTWEDHTAYATGVPIFYSGQYWRCFLTHTSNAAANWVPGVASSLWARIDDPAEEWPEWVQPTGSHDAYDLGAKVSYEGRHWICTLQGNVYPPGTYGWEEVF